MKLDFDNCEDEEVNSSFHTLSSGCDVDDGGDLSGDDIAAVAPPSPSPARLFSPRKSSRPVIRPECETSPHVAVDSPPYKKIRALRLFDSPATPKTLLQKSTTESSSRVSSRSRLFPNLRQRPLVSSSSQVNTTPSTAPSQSKDHPGKCSAKGVANINPFTPTGMLLSRKRTRSKRELTSPTG